ncbi:MAG: Gfo/Idh/MocA family oxidoreductase, partial [Oscillospiraceae bacterium]|nr:Gfo/Idh/MocA family oxidoreductase [Oscillospiraceae bacterium]
MQCGWGLIGFGGMGGWHMRNIMESIPELQVIGAYDIRPETYEGLPEGVVGYPTLQALLDDERIALVTVATPNNFHKDLVIACLKAGKHVVCEKPVAMDAAELEAMRAMAECCGKTFSIHQNRRWDRDYLMVRQLLAQGDLGQPYFIESRVQGSRQSMHGWRGHRENGGGMIYDWGIHLFDQLLDLIPSPVVSVLCQAKNVHNDEVDDSFKAILQFENGVSALVEIATNCFINLPRWHVSCPGGTIEIKDWQCNGSVVRLNTDAEMGWDDEIVYTDAGPTRTMAPRPKETLA